jgi:hypothetical protein
MVKRLRLAAALAWLALASVGLPGCAYRMPAAAAPSLPRLRLAAQSPRQYVVRLETGGIKDYPVPADGRVTLEVPGARPRCQVYLFNWIRVGGGADPSKLWRIEVLAGGKSVRTLPLDELLRLPMDPSQDHVLRLAE